MSEQHRGLPVAGYASTQSAGAVAAVTRLKHLEERFLRELDGLAKTEPGFADPRCLAEARTCVQTGTMWAARAIFQPQRVALPEDEA